MTARAAGPLLPFQPGKPVGTKHYGACSWTDRTLIDAGTFYSPSVRTAADRLTHYASQFPIVEVDATYYALPLERNAHLWVERTPRGFVFNIKAFGLFHPSPRGCRAAPGCGQEAVAGCASGEEPRLQTQPLVLPVLGSAGPVVHDLLTALSNFLGVSFARDFRLFTVWAATPDVRRLRT